MIASYPVERFPFQPGYACVSSPFTGLPSADGTHPPGTVDNNRFHEWPWRGLAFASDLGTVGYLVNKPRLGLLGWAIATPYYLASILSRSTSRQRERELVYQATANGLFPLLEIKLGLLVADRMVKNLPPRLQQLPTPLLKGLAGLFFLLTLTPLVGDPVSRALVNRYRQFRGDTSPWISFSQ